MFDDVFSPPGILVSKATRLLEEYNQAHSPNTPMEVTREESNPTQQKSPLGLLKVNWDAALAKISKQMGVGVVVWDVDGRYVALATVIPHITDPTTGETLATWRPVMLCWDLGFTRFVMEGDSKTVVLAINETFPCFSSYGHILEAIQNRLQALP